MDRNLIRILNLKHRISSDGATMAIINLYSHIDRSKVQFDFLVYDRTNNGYTQFIEKLGGNIYSIPVSDGDIKIVRIVKRCLALYKFFKRNSYNAIHIHTDNPFRVLELFIAKIAGVKVRIIHSHGIGNAEEGKPISGIKKSVQKLCKIMINKTATDLFACSSVAAKEMYSENVTIGNNLKVINNGIEIEKYIYNEDVRRKYRKLLGIENKFVVGHIGRFAHVKNHEFLIDVFKEIQNENPESVLLLVGEGDLESNIKTKVKESNLVNSVKFLGQRLDVPQLLQAMDVFVFPSYFEGLGIVVIESQAASLQTFCSDTIPRQTKITEYIEYLSLEQSAYDWAEMILKYNDGYQRRNTLGDIREAGFDIKQVAKELENFYVKECKKQYRRMS